MLLEKLFAMFLAITITALLLDGLKAQRLVAERVKRVAAVIQQNDLIDSLMEQVIDDLDEHRLPLFPKVEDVATLRFSNGTPHPLMLRTDRLALHPDSNPITFLRLSRGNALLITIQQQICSSFEDRLHTLAYDGARYYETEVHKVAGSSGGCTPVALLTPHQSVLFDQPSDVQTTSPFLLLPIDSIVTLYVSRERTLRYVQHRGDIVIENQPLIESAPLVILRDLIDEHSRYSITVEKHHEEGRSIFINVHSSKLSRYPFESSLLQLQRGNHHLW